MRLAPLAVLVGLAVTSFVFVRVNSGSGDAFVANQRMAQALTPAGVERVVRTAPDPVGGRRGRSAGCVALGRGELRNPWRCTISYADGRRIQYTVQLHLDGSFAGSDEIVHYGGRSYHDTGQINGCCVVIP